MNKLKEILFIILIFFIFYSMLCTLIALIVATYKTVRYKLSFKESYRNTFLYFFFEMFDPFNYF